MKSKFLDFDLQALWRATAREIENAGWDVDPQALLKEAGRPGGPTIYLCHYEAQFAIMVSLIPGALERMQAELGAKGFTFQDACNILGSLMDDVAAKKASLSDKVRVALSCAAGLYIAGTQVYPVAREQLADQYLVIRQYDVSRSAGILRPAATHAPGPLTPQEVAEFVLRVLKDDRLIHPERFRKGQPLRFFPKPL